MVRRSGDSAERRHPSENQLLALSQAHYAGPATFGVWILTSVFYFSTFAQYSIDWLTIDGGSGGTSTGGVFSVSGTIGQPDAGTMSGGNFTIDGGFWGIIAAVQTSGAPLLSVARSGNNVIVSWPVPSIGCVLQENPILAASNWTNVSASPATNGLNLEVVVPAPVGNQFYRLRHP